MSEKLDHMKDQKEKVEQKLRYYQHQEKMLEHGAPDTGTHQQYPQMGL